MVQSNILTIKIQVSVSCVLFINKQGKRDLAEQKSHLYLHLVSSSTGNGVGTTTKPNQKKKRCLSPQVSKGGFKKAWEIFPYFRLSKSHRCKLQQGRSRLDVREIFLIQKQVKHWCPSVFVESIHCCRGRYIS